MAQFVQVTIQLVPKGEWNFPTQTYGTSFVWSSGSLDEQVQIFVAQCVTDAANFIKVHAEAQRRDPPLTDAMAQTLARYCFVYDVTQQPNELPDPPAKPSVAESALAEMRAIQEQIAELEQRKTGDPDASFFVIERYNQGLITLRDALVRVAYKTSRSIPE